jgi:hypothetical protein
VDQFIEHFLFGGNLAAIPTNKLIKLGNTFMTFSWQDIAAVVVIVTAMVYLVMRLFRIGPWKQKPFCGTCDMCGVEQPEQKIAEIKLTECSQPEQSERSSLH